MIQIKKLEKLYSNVNHFHILQNLEAMSIDRIPCFFNICKWSGTSEEKWIVGDYRRTQDSDRSGWETKKSAYKNSQIRTNVLKISVQI